MARRTIVIDGDASGVKVAAASATKYLKEELEAQKKALADARQAQKALSKEATAEERAAAKEATRIAKETLDAKRRAYAESAADAKAASQAARQAAREEAAGRAEVLRELRRSAQWQAGAGTRGAPADQEPDDKARRQAAEGAKRFAAGMIAAAATLSRAIQQLEQLESKLLDRTLSASEQASRRAESLRLAGVSGAADLGARIGAGNANLSPSDINAALDQLAMEGSGRISGAQVESVMRGAGRGTAGSALVAASFGLETGDAITLAERYRLQSRGGSLSRAQAAAVAGLQRGGNFRSLEDIADYLAAAQEAGTDLSGINPRRPFLNQGDTLLNAFTRNTQRASTRETGLSVIERQRNQAQNLIDAALATGDQSQAILTQERAFSAEQADILTAQEGPSGSRAVRQALGTVGLDGAAARYGLLPNQGRAVRVEVVNPRSVEP